MRVDGISVGTLSSYTFTNVVSAHTIAATFSKKVTAATYSLMVSKKGSGGGAVSKTLPVPFLVRVRR